ncbi:MAG: hypothetical protein MK078_10050 [Crocinitomicaceae bacterium]|nr:hypothetical protein [Crocinitomicaceae bacterium]
MKSYILLILLGVSGLCYSQEEEEDEYNYDYNVYIKLAGVTDVHAAKYATDPIRYKYKTFPTFNDSTDQFEFVSIYNFPEEEISLLMSAEGYTLEFYECIIIRQEGEEELEEIENE